MLDIDGRLIDHHIPPILLLILQQIMMVILEGLELIYLAAEAGADVAKFQHFKAATIVSDSGFRALGGHSRISQIGKNRFLRFTVKLKAYLDWTEVLKQTCEDAGITFTSPYSQEIVDYIDQFVPAYDRFSDITWIEMVEHIASKGKPYILAAGASTADEVDRAAGRTFYQLKYCCPM